MNQEMFIVAEKQKTELNEEQIISYLKEIVDKIRTEEDPLELNEYRRLFRKAVPFTLRSYFAAYLLKQQFAGKQSSRSTSRNERSGRNNKKERTDSRPLRQEEPKRGRGADTRRQEGRIAEGRGEGRSNESRSGESRPSEGRSGEGRISESRVAEPRIVLADEVSTTLFISIGRNRRVYPRDLIGLIMQNVEIEREHIGEIRVLDNYSFVQVITEDAEKIIASLNEFEYRGRKLAVSYSRKRDDQGSPGNAGSDSIEHDSVEHDNVGIDSGDRNDPVDGDDEPYDETSTRNDSWISETDSPDDEEHDPDIQ